MSTREVVASTSTEHPNSVWVVDQTAEYLDQTTNREQKPSIVMHDRDTKFSTAFKEKLRVNNVKTNVLPKTSPNLNGRVERVILTLKRECLSKFILFGKEHLDYLLDDFVGYYNEHRSHMDAITCRRFAKHQTKSTR